MHITLPRVSTLSLGVVAKLALVDDIRLSHFRTSREAGCEASGLVIVGFEGERAEAGCRRFEGETHTPVQCFSSISVAASTSTLSYRNGIFT